MISTRQTDFTGYTWQVVLQMNGVYCSSSEFRTHKDAVGWACKQARDMSLSITSKVEIIIVAVNRQPITKLSVTLCRKWVIRNSTIMFIARGKPVADLYKASHYASQQSALKALRKYQKSGKLIEWYVCPVYLNEIK